MEKVKGRKAKGEMAEKLKSKKYRKKSVFRPEQMSNITKTQSFSVERFLYIYSAVVSHKRNKAAITSTENVNVK